VQYQGNIDEPTGLIDMDVEAMSNMWPGLYYDEWGIGNGNLTSPFYFEYWAGIDCVGLVMQALRYAGDPQRYKDVQQLSASTDQQLPGVKLGGVCTTYNCGSNGLSIYLDPHSGPLMKTSVKLIFDQTNKDLFYYWSKVAGGKNEKVIHQGDFIHYDAGHISTVHSPKAACDDNGDNCTYEIIHASGDGQICYDRGRGQKPSCTFNRKAVINEIIKNLTSTTLKNPTGFGRIKLWD